MEEKLKEVHELLGRTKLNVNEQWMFDNYWNNPKYEFRKDDYNKLNVRCLEGFKDEDCSYFTK